MDRVRSRAVWLRRQPHSAAVAVDGEQVVHGDYQDSNLFFEDGVVSSIIDWDTSGSIDPVHL